MGPALVLAAAALLATARVTLRPGWPENHDGTMPIARAVVFRDAFRAGEPFPVFTIVAQNGHGSTFPFFYHRLFSTLAGALALAAPPVAAVKLALVLVLFAGALGMFRLLRAVGVGTGGALCGGALLLFANYAYTAWLVRGALAELTAFMLVPWLLLAARRVVAGARLAGAGLGVAMALLFFAHSALFLFSAPIPAAAFLAAATPWRERVKSLLAALGVFALLAGPSLVGVLLFKGGLSFPRMLDGPLDVLTNFAPWSRLLFDSGRSYSVEIGWRFVLPALAALALLAARRAAPRSVDRRFAALLLVWGAVYLFLERPASSFVYGLFPDARYLQFPFRLHVFLTVLAIALLCAALQELAAAGGRARLLAPAALAAIVLAQAAWGLGQGAGRRWHEPEEIAAALSPKARRADLVFGGEYLPRGVAPVPPPRPFVSISGGRLVSAGPPDAYAGGLVRDVALEVDAGPACAVSFAAFANPFLVAEGGLVEPGPWSTIVVRPAPGRRTVRLRSQGLFAALAARARSTR